MISGINSTYDIAKQKANIQKAEKNVENFENKLNTALNTEKKEEIEKAAKEFETYFIGYMYKEMRKTIDDSNSLIPKSQAQKTFEDMLVDEYAKNSTLSGGIGLAKMMVEQMTKNMSEEV